MSPADKPVRVGMLGCGVVGSQVARLLLEDTEELSTRAGVSIELTSIAVRTIKPYPGLDPTLFTTDPFSIVNDPEIDLIIEVMGGIEPARELAMTAINNRKSIVTANKALLASHGADLFTAAYAKGEDIYYEASVAGAIPIIRPLRDSLAGDFVTRLMGIVNGTTNYILTKSMRIIVNLKMYLKRRKPLVMQRQTQLQISKDLMLRQKLQFSRALPSTLA